MTTQFTSAAFRASALFFLLPISFLSGQDIFKITDNSLPDEKPVVSGQYVAWRGYDGDYEIYGYNLETGVTTQITDNTVSDGEPQICNNFVVWDRSDGADTEVFLYDMVSGVTTQITDNSFYHDFNPVVSNHYIAWLGTYADDFEVYGYSMETGEITRITDNSFNDQGLKISGPNLVWMGNGHIFWYNFETGMTAQLTQGAGNRQNPDISGNSVVWQGMDSEGDSEIFAHNLSTGVTIQVTDNALWDNFPKISGNYIVWYDISLIYGGQTDVFFYDMGTGEITQLPNETDSEFFCEVDGNTIVYNRYTGTSYEIILYDIKTGLISQITDHDFGGSFPHISGDYVVWQGSDGADMEIFGYKLCYPCTPQEKIDALIEAVTGLFEKGLIGNGPYNAFMNQLNKVLNGITNENPCKAIQKLEVFITLVEAYIPNQLSEEEGQKLIAAAQALIDQLDCLEVPKNANAVKLELALYPCVPNPAVAQTSIAFTVPAPGPVFLAVYDVTGSQVRVLAEGEYSAGLHQVEVQVGQWEEGVYFYSLKIPGEAVKTERMVIVR